MTATLEIVVPYYQGSRFLGECLDSVVRQSSSGWLCTVIDDASPEDRYARDLVQRLADPRIRYLRHPQNLGIAETFTHALECSRGAWTTILGQDDRLLPGYVASITATAAGSSDGVTMLQPGVQVIDDAGERVRPLADRVKAVLRPRAPAVLSGQRLAASLLVGNWLYFPSIAWRTDRAREFGFDPGLKTTMDLDHVLRQLQAGHALQLSGEECFEYRRHRGSESSQARLHQRFDEEAALHRNWGRTFRQAGWPAAWLAGSLRPSTRLHSGLVALQLPMRRRNLRSESAARLRAAGPRLQNAGTPTSRISDEGTVRADR